MGRDLGVTEPEAERPWRCRSMLDPDYANEIVQRYGGLRPAARATGEPYTNINRAYQVFKQRGSEPLHEVDLQDEEVDQAMDDMARLKEEIKRANRRIGELTKENDTAARIRETIYKLEGTPPNPPTWVHEP